MRKVSDIMSIVAGLIILIGAAGCDTDTKAPAISAQVLHSRSLAEAGLGGYWERQIPLIAQERLVAADLLGGGVVLCSNAANLYSIDAATGSDRWVVPVKITARNEGVFAPTFFPELHIAKNIGGVSTILNPPDLEKIPAFDAILINTYSRYLIINSKTGRVVRDTDFNGFTATNGGVTDGQRYYVGSNSKHLFAINMLSAVIQWSKDIGEITVPVVLSGQRIFVGTTGGTFACYTAAETSQRNWRLSLDGGVKTAFCVDDRGAFVASDDGNINGLDQRGYPLWADVHAKALPVGKMQIGKKTIFQPVTTGLCAVDLTDGQLRWTIRGGRKVLAVMDGVVYILTADRKMLLVNEVTGGVLFTVSMEFYDFFAANTTIPAIYAGTADGRLCCIRQLNAPKLR